MKEINAEKIIESALRAESKCLSKIVVRPSRLSFTGVVVVASFLSARQARRFAAVWSEKVGYECKIRINRNRYAVSVPAVAPAVRRLGAVPVPVWEPR